MIIALNLLSIMVIGVILSLAIILLSWDPITPIVFKDPSSVAIVPTVISDLQGSDHRSSSWMLGLPSQISVMVKDVASRLFWSEWACLIQ